MLFNNWWLLYGKPGYILCTENTLDLSIFMKHLHCVTFVFVSIIQLCRDFNFFFFLWPIGLFCHFRNQVENKIANHRSNIFNGLKSGFSHASAKDLSLHLHGVNVDLFIYFKVTAYGSRKKIVFYMCISIHVLCLPGLCQWNIPEDRGLTYSLKLVAINF